MYICRDYEEFRACITPLTEQCRSIRNRLKESWLPIITFLSCSCNGTTRKSSLCYSGRQINIMMLNVGLYYLYLHFEYQHFSKSNKPPPAGPPFLNKFPIRVKKKRVAVSPYLHIKNRLIPARTNTQIYMISLFSLSLSPSV